MLPDRRRHACLNRAVTAQGESVEIMLGWCENHAIGPSRAPLRMCARAQSWPLCQSCTEHPSTGSKVVSNHRTGKACRARKGGAAPPRSRMARRAAAQARDARSGSPECPASARSRCPPVHRADSPAKALQMALLGHPQLTVHLLSNHTDVPPRCFVVIRVNKHQAP